MFPFYNIITQDLMLRDFAKHNFFSLDLHGPHLLDLVNKEDLYTYVITKFSFHHGHMLDLGDLHKSFCLDSFTRLAITLSCLLPLTHRAFIFFPDSCHRSQDLPSLFHNAYQALWFVSCLAHKICISLSWLLLRLALTFALSSQGLMSTSILLLSWLTRLVPWPWLLPWLTGFCVSKFP